LKRLKKEAKMVKIMCENHAKCVQINKKPLDGTAELICTGAKS
jgi:hypothetical protein